MSFLNYIEEIRKKPEDARKRIAFLWAALVTSVIFIVWLTIFLASISNEKEKPITASPISVIKDIKDSILKGATK